MSGVSRYLAYLYLLRVPLLVWLFLLGLAPLSVWGAAPLGPALRGLFDLAPPPTTEPDTRLMLLRIFFAFGVVSLQALMVATSIAVTARLIVLDGGERFKIGVVENTPGIRLVFRALPAVAAIVLVAGAWSQSWVPGWRRFATMAGGTATGTLLFVAVLAGGQRWILEPLHRRKHSAVSGWIASRGMSGYTRVDAEGLTRVHERHVHALFQGLAALGVYVLLFLFKQCPTVFGVTLCQPDVTWVPTLCLVLTLASVVCFVLGSMTFFFDRYRIPIVLVVVVYFSVVGLAPEADSFFATRDGADDSWKVTNAPLEQLMRGANRSAPVIVIAATGGGIQAAAWTARVLAGLHQRTQDDGVRFDEAVRIISSVSGGSVGALFLLDDWGRTAPGRLPPLAHAPAALDEYAAVTKAEASSLDEVAWGLVYTDLVYALAPKIRVTERMRTSDRGSALESAWRARMSNSSSLGQWRRDAFGGVRPAVIFNATLVETGERLLMSTSDLEWRSAQGAPWCSGKAPAASNAGRRDFRTLYCDREIEAVTAARLSATFPYVSPATRILRKNNPRQAEYHVVDGGYYDNYGVATLVEWIEDAVRNGRGRSMPPVLLIEIRAKPVATPSEPSGARGLTFQALHPLTTMLQVWGTGQLSHNELDARLVQDRERRVTLRRVIFEFPGREPDGVAIHPPLSWHLTPDETTSLRRAWRDDMAPCVEFVRRFLRDPGGAAKARVEAVRCPA